MSDLLAARSQMAVSLMFHILFAVAGMAMPVMMVASEAWWQRTGDPVYLDLTRRWARGTAILFAVGAVSGTVLSFELGLLWPRFMQYAGALIGMPFSLEGFAFLPRPSSWASISTAGTRCRRARISLPAWSWHCPAPSPRCSWSAPTPG
jgi:cytochrome bd-type quinol oxidase subunit 1